MIEVLENTSKYLQPTTEQTVLSNIQLNKRFKRNMKVETIKSFLDDPDEPRHVWRLPKTSTPISYDLHLITNIHTGDLPVVGEVSIRIKILETTDKIMLHSKSITITELKLFNIINVEVPNVNFTLYEPTEILAVNLDSNATKDTIFTTKIKYGFRMYDPPTDLMVGFYRTSYETVHGNKRFVRCRLQIT